MATQNLVAENTFMQGLLPKYAYAIRIAPTILNLNQKVEYTNRIYTSGRTSGNTQVPVPLLPSRTSVQPTTVAPIPLPSPPMNQPVAPAPAADPVMDRLAEEFARLTAHLVNRDRRYEGDQFNDLTVTTQGGTSIKEVIGISRTTMRIDS